MAKVEINADGRTVSIEDATEDTEYLSGRALALWKQTENNSLRGHGAFGFSSERRPQSYYDAVNPVHAKDS